VRDHAGNITFLIILFHKQKYTHEEFCNIVWEK